MGTIVCSKAHQNNHNPNKNVIFSLLVLKLIIYCNIVILADRPSIIIRYKMCSIWHTS